LSQEWYRWHSCHLYYHGDGNLLLGRLVHPLMVSLLRKGDVDRFFFVRYELGGPHVRLRWRVAPGATGRADEAVAKAAADFFARWPSAQSLATDTVERRTQQILAADASESDGILYSDNSLRFTPFVPEVDRYGGPGLIGASLDFFNLSSLRALGFARAFTGEPRTRQIPWILRTLAAQAMGFARDEPELASLLDYAAVPAGHPLAPFAARGDQAFKEQPESFQRLLREALSEHDRLAEARHLAAAVGSATPDARHRILKSHMHMTANRLGLRNPEETWLGQILRRAAATLPGSCRPAPEEPLDPGRGLEDLLSAAFTTIMAPEAPVAAGSHAFTRR